MSEFIAFFAAPGDRAAARVRRRGPAPAGHPHVSATGFDADDAVVTWENVLTGRDRPHEATPGDPRMVAEFQNDGSAVFQLSADLAGRLAALGPDDTARLATAWCAAEPDLPAAAAVDVLLGVAGLARTAAGSGARLYCWVCS